LREIVFPRDEGWHPDASDEWWYFNGHLSSADGMSIGVAISFFPNSILGIIVDSGQGRVLHKSTSWGRSFEGSTERLDIRYGQSWWKRLEGGTPRYAIHYEADGTSVDLTMESTKKPLLVDGTGNVKEGLLGRSYYYAQTSLRVKGEVMIGSRALQVAGRGWIDRQWGKWQWSGLGGWRWFSVQLDGDTEVLGIQFAHPLNGFIVSQSFNLSRSSSESQVLRKVSVFESGAWRSPETGTTYGMGWVVLSPGLLNLTITPVVESQEVNKGLWEGDCVVRGEFEGQPAKGRAYVELSNSRVYGGLSSRLAFLAIGLIDQTVARGSRRLRLVDRTLKLLYRS